MIHELTNTDFDSEVLQADELVLVDFYAVWCGPCQLIAPHVDALAEQYPTLKVCRIDVDSAGAIAARYGIVSIPTLIYFRGGAVVKTVVGYRTREELRAMTEELL